MEHRQRADERRDAGRHNSGAQKQLRQRRESPTTGQEAPEDGRPLGGAAEPVGAVGGGRPTRRTVLGRGARLLVYTAPLVQLFRPSEALAAYGVYS